MPQRKSTNGDPVVKRLGQVTTESVFKHTGRHWDDWISLLEKRSGRAMSHRELTHVLKTKFKLSPWWQFCVALGFQYHTGQKVAGVNAKGEFAIGISRTLPVSREKLWHWLQSEEGQALWLRPLSRLEFQKKAQFEVEGGIFGEIRTLKEPERLRLTWQDTEWLKPTIVQVMLHSRPGGKSGFGISHEGIKDARAKEVLKEHWRERLDEISAHFKTRGVKLSDGKVDELRKRTAQRKTQGRSKAGR